MTYRQSEYRHESTFLQKRRANIAGIFYKNTLVEKTQFLDGNFNQNSMIMSSDNQLQ